MSRVRAVFLGTPDIAAYCLRAMIADDHYEVVGVLSQPDRPAGRKLQLTPSPVKSIAVAEGIPVLTPEKASVPEVIEAVQAWNAEVAVVVAFGQILRQNFLDLFPRRVVNVHASLLPHLRGAAPIQRALMNGDRETGVCLQVMVKALDAGPTLGSRVIPLDDEINAIELYARCREQGAQLIAVDLMDYVRGNLSPVPQDESKVTYAKKIEKSEGEIDWSWPAKRVHDLVRGLAMGPNAYTRRDGKILKIYRTRVGDRTIAVGRVEVHSNLVFVGCGEGSLELLVVQPESRAQMPIAEYQRGYPFTAGVILGDPQKPHRPEHPVR